MIDANTDTMPFRRAERSFARNLLLARIPWRKMLRIVVTVWKLKRASPGESRLRSRVCGSLVGWWLGERRMPLQEQAGPANTGARGMGASARCRGGPLLRDSGEDALRSRRAGRRVLVLRRACVLTSPLALGKGTRGNRVGEDGGEGALVTDVC